MRVGLQTLLIVWIESCSPFVLLLQGVKCSHRSTHVRGYPSIHHPQTKAEQTDISTMWKWLKLKASRTFYINPSLCCSGIMIKVQNSDPSILHAAFGMSQHADIPFLFFCQVQCTGILNHIDSMISLIIQWKKLFKEHDLPTGDIFLSEKDLLMFETGVGCVFKSWRVVQWAALIYFNVSTFIINLTLTRERILRPNCRINKV